VTGEDVDWLLALSRGQTVVELADDVGYSERSMFRKLHELYERLGVTNRSAALLEAQRLGLLETDEATG
jgi:DNA-binding NarL/FixJ family response regulator